MTIKCHEFFGCTKDGCIMHEDAELRRCWDVEPEETPCIKMFAEPMSRDEKMVFCRNCLYYEHINKPKD